MYARGSAGSFATTSYREENSTRGIKCTIIQGYIYLNLLVEVARVRHFARLVGNECDRIRMSAQSVFFAKIAKGPCWNS